MKAFTLKDIALAGLVAAVYAVLGLVFLPISFGVYQVRVAEALTVLPFLTRAAVPGLFIGCMVANVYGGMGWQDIIFGSIITLTAAVLTRLAGKITRTSLSYGASSIPVILLWAGGLVLLCQGTHYKLAFFLVILSNCLNVLAGTGAGSKPAASTALRAISAVAMLGAFISAFRPEDWMTYTMGVVALIGSWLLFWYLRILQRRGDNPNLLLAPLPPVILNAFGVALYLAPILEFDYWFVVQMVGVGQLIACYVLGLPLLRLLLKRKNLFA